MSSSAVVWFKRDLRITDHAPLVAAAECDAALALFVIEPEWLDSPEFDGQHLDFTLACLAEPRGALAARGLPLLVLVGALLEVFGTLRKQFAFTHLFSHEETGPGWTYSRDRGVAAWCRAAGVRWQQWPQTGVVRPLATRTGWAARWAARMNARPWPTPAGWRGADVAMVALPTAAGLGVPAHGRSVPAAGEGAAQAVLDSFVRSRGRGYRRALSSPLTAETGCSRISAHLAFGTLSVRQVHQATEAHIARARAEGDVALANGLRGFSSRLRWRCHFMQKLEDEPDIEHRNFARTYDGLRPGDIAGGAPPLNGAQRRAFEAWCAGRTGFPMVDACMRSLCATGWLNFRMRAMLVSFASYHLWLHWRETGQFLARQFLDFEPGIHWSQMQMQSGTTGINTLRMYSPAKQARDHDPDGAFVRRWVPEFGTASYPEPIVDERSALKLAKETMYGLRAQPGARAEADAVQQKHGSRKSGLAPSSRPRGPTQAAGFPGAARAAESTPQLDLFS